MESGHTLAPTKDYRFRQPKGRNIEVFYNSERKWRSTGTKNPAEALRFAERGLLGLRPKAGPMTLKAYTREFFLPGRCPYLRRTQDRGDTLNQQSIARHRSNLVNYIWPALGTRVLSSITRRDIEDSIIGLRIYRTKQPASRETKNKVINTWRRVLDQAEYDEIVPINVSRLVKQYSNTDSRQTQIFTREEYGRFFPEDRAEMLHIWGGPFWSTFFLVLATTGARQGQVAALRWDNWFSDIGGLWSMEAVEERTGELKGIKTAKKGLDAVPLVLTSRANFELKAWREITDYPADEDLIFHWNSRASARITLGAATVNKHLKAAARRAGVDRVGPGMRTPKSWRHSFSTDMLSMLDEGTVQEAFGHVQGSRVTGERYDHRSAEQRIQTIKKRVQFAVERRMA